RFGKNGTWIPACAGMTSHAPCGWTRIRIRSLSALIRVEPLSCWSRHGFYRRHSLLAPDDAVQRRIDAADQAIRIEVEPDLAAHVHRQALLDQARAEAAAPGRMHRRPVVLAPAHAKPAFTGFADDLPGDVDIPVRAGQGAVLDRVG